MSNSKYPLLLLLTILLCACGSQEPASSTSAAAEAPDLIATSNEPETGEMMAEPLAEAAEDATSTAEPLYAWVSTLNVRDQPATSGAIVTTVQPQDTLLPTGKRSPQNTTLSLRGMTFNEPWLEVGTPDGKQGWVFAGTLQTANQRNSSLLGEPENFQYEKCPGVGGPEDSMEGCGCQLKKLFGKNAWINVSFSGAACINLDGQTQQLNGYYDHYASLDTKRPWVVLEEEGSKLFGNPAPLDYESTVIRLTDALLHFDNIPSEIPLENKVKGGMYIHEVRDMATDAIAAAKKRRAAGERTGDARWVYINDQYRVIISANEYKNPMQDEGTSYEGLMQVEDAKGKLLTRVPVKGSCGC